MIIAMLRNLILLIFVTLVISVKADIPPPPDFTLTSVDGVTYNLYSELEKGKTVALIFFGVNCGTCQEAVPTIELVWQRDAQLGEKGWVWAIETGGVSNEQIEEFMQTYGATYVFFRAEYGDSVLSEQYGYNINYTPQYYVICSDLSYKTSSLENISEIFKGCSGINIESVENQDVAIEIQDNNIFVTGVQLEKQSKVTVIDMLGRVVIQTTSNNSENQIVLEKPAMPGLYILTMHFIDGKVVSKKIMITN
jgi:thiol-disulfide isomerase/thioredoxin